MVCFGAAEALSAAEFGTLATDGSCVVLGISDIVYRSTWRWF